MLALQLYDPSHGMVNARSASRIVRQSYESEYPWCSTQGENIKGLQWKFGEQNGANVTASVGLNARRINRVVEVQVRGYKQSEKNDGARNRGSGSQAVRQRSHPTVDHRSRKVSGKIPMGMFLVLVLDTAEFELAALKISTPMWKVGRTVTH
jgi:hypothetical protein